MLKNKLIDNSSLSKKKISNAFYYIFFIMFAYIPYILMNVIPFFRGIYISFFSWNGVSEHMNFVGFKNYTDLLDDRFFKTSFRFTILFVIATVLIVNLLALLFAMALNKRLKTRYVLRTLLFLPQLISPLIIGFIWHFIFARVLVSFGEKFPSFGIFQFNWLGYRGWAFWAVCIVFIWQYAGYLMLIYLAALQGIPIDVIEASTIDGAKGFKRTMLIILPMIRHAFTVCFFLAIVSAFRVYDIIVMLTNGSPFYTTSSLTHHIYSEAFISFHMGTGSAKAIVFFIVLAVISIIQISIMSRREIEA